MKRILGIDVSRNWAIVVLLCEFPSVSPLQYSKNIGEPIKGYSRIKGNTQLNEIAYKLECNAEAIEIVKSLEVDAIILEPTGYWYASFWVNCAKKLGLDIYWISHQQTKINRQHYFKTKNKDDYLDALTIALTYFDKSGLDDLGNPPILNNYDHDSIDLLRLTFHEREQLDKNKNSLINQLRQRLCCEFPEIAQKDFEYIGVNGHNPTLGHIAGLKKNSRIKDTAGTGIKEYSRLLACDIITYQSRILVKEQELREILGLSHFKPYCQVFDQFLFGTVTQSLLLLHCYPIERFLVNGKRYFRSNHDISLRKFQAYLGLSYSYQISGDTSAKQNKVKKSWKGSDLVRSHLYAHAMVTICPNKPAKTEIIAKLKNSWLNPRSHSYFTQNEKTGQKTKVTQELPSFKALGKDGLCRLLFYETRLLYRLLTGNLVK
ncbi:hypothetical protein MiAbW_03426 [Microcystis aeruginosa NIES-4325]|uniref:Uncharacterized protein n=2 Tax=Microcystis aeruginosa TaxID=1126 RepID=A0A5J4FEC0_MICAE|nr:hypothetical protein [Microcystis aeruginosa]GEA28845.1 hypothetical protein MiAbW_03426 [Microcystis aeruginosa NIES-4325]